MTDRKPANAEMVEGYMDGYNLDAPSPSANRSYSYRHGFAVGRAERSGSSSLADFDTLEHMADIAVSADEAR